MARSITRSSWTGTGPPPVSSVIAGSCRGPPRTNAVPSTGWPANGISPAGMKMRMRACPPAAGGSTNTVYGTIGLEIKAGAVGATATPSVVAAVASVGTPTVTTGGEVTVDADTVLASAGVGSPTINGEAVAAPSVGAASTAVGMPAVTANAGASAEVPETAATVAHIPTPLITGAVGPVPPGPELHA